MDETGNNPVKLAYATPGKQQLVRLAEYVDGNEAEIHAAALRSMGIPVAVMNQNLNALGFMYGGSMPAELFVAAQDVEEAHRLIDKLDWRDLEPVEGPMVTPLDDQGQPLALEPVARFDHVWQMRDAQTILASMNIASYLPPMAPSASGSPLTASGRFVLRVASRDLAAAEALLSDDENDEDWSKKRRCPECRSRRVFCGTQALQRLRVMLRLAPSNIIRAECLDCGSRGPAEHFDAI